MSRTTAKNYAAQGGDKWVVEGEIQISGKMLDGEGNEVTPGGGDIADGSVTTAKIADGAVVDEKLANPKVNKSGDTMTGPIVFADPNNRSKLILTKYPDGTGHSNAPTTFDLNSVYLHLGGTEYAPNSYRLLGFGFRHHEDTSHAAAVVGYQEIDTNGNDMGDIIAATRNSTTDVAPTIHLRVKHDGQVELEQENYIPASDKAIPNKKYVDGLVPSKLSAVDPIADPSTATAEDIANAFNALLNALKS